MAMHLAMPGGTAKRQNKTAAYFTWWACRHNAAPRIYILKRLLRRRRRVGTDVGDFVGCGVVGRWVGFLVGFLVGAFVGLVVGLAVIATHNGNSPSFRGMLNPSGVW